MGAAVILWALPVWAADIVYSSTIEDLPLMQGMYELPRESLTFDTPQGRIVETTIETSDSKKKVLEFYSQNLPALGWDTKDHMAYVRDDEQLTMEFGHAERGTLVHFTLTPFKGK